jgi:hypothetical protein
MNVFRKYERGEHNEDIAIFKEILETQRSQSVKLEYSSCAQLTRTPSLTR